MKHRDRYATPETPEAQWEPGSRGRVLRNRLHIRGARAMDLAEYSALLEVQTRYLRIVTPELCFTAAYLRQMHRDWMGGIYEWAGRYRMVSLEKAGFRWPPPGRVEANMRTFEETTLREHTPCLPGRIDSVCRAIAIVHAEFLIIHPFRDGNGRLARWLADLMALQAGLPAPHYGFVGRGSRVERGRYLAAVQRGYLTDYEDLAAFFRDAIERREDAF